jgi:hypothetical protein
MNRSAEVNAAVRRVFFYGLAGLLGAAFAAAIALWTKYGTAVFFESIRSGLANCFG